MKKLAFLLLLSLSACSSPTAEPEFFLELTLDEEESSDDSNGTSESLRIEGDKAYYSWSYFGYHPDEDYDRDKTEKLTLSEEEIIELKNLLILEELWTSILEEQDTSGLGDSVELSLTVVDGEQEVNTSISGMSWSLETREGNIENTATIDSAEKVIHFIEDLL